MKLHKVQEQWRAYNSQHFSGLLRPVRIQITRSSANYGKFVYPVKHGACEPVIHISGCINTEDTWRDALLHEMIHQFLYESRIEEDDIHGPIFVEWATKLGVSLDFDGAPKNVTIQASEAKS